MQEGDASRTGVNGGKVIAPESGISPSTKTHFTGERNLIIIHLELKHCDQQEMGD